MHYVLQKKVALVWFGIEPIYEVECEPTFRDNHLFIVLYVDSFFPFLVESMIEL